MATLNSVDEHLGNAQLDSSNGVELAISVRGLRKVFGTKVAVRGLTLDVPQGEVFGFLGPNGAGKSTSIKMLLGLVKPTRGSAFLLGRALGDREARRRVGFLPEHFRFYDWLTSSELLRAHAQLCGLHGRELEAEIPRMLDLVGLTPHAGKQLRRYSKGMLQRIGLAQALIHKPDLIFLDEPTSGLDPVGRRLVRDIIRLQKERGATVFLNSHLLSEVEAVCDRVAFIRSGTVVETRTMRDLEQGQCSVVVRGHGMTEKVLSGLAQWVTQANIEGATLKLRLHSAEAAPHLVRFLVEAGVDVYEFSLQRETLEDRFLALVSGDSGL